LQQSAGERKPADIYLPQIALTEGRVNHLALPFSFVSSLTPNPHLTVSTFNLELAPPATPKEIAVTSNLPTFTS
jgi:hypothetical protein